MCVRERIKYGVIVCLLMLGSSVARAESTDPAYLCEAGLFGGCGYYVGDATPHIFMNVREVYGLQFRYKFTKRWAIQAKGQLQRITGNEYVFRSGQVPERLDSRWENNMINVDVMAEFNFFRFGTDNPYDKRIKPYTPYIFLGIGAGIYGAEGYTNAQFKHAMAYFPFGIGFKWKFHDRCGLNVAWQHNVFFADNLENRPNLDNRYDLNGGNIMNCDLTGQLTLGIVFEFGVAKKPCRVCNSD